MAEHKQDHKQEHKKRMSMMPEENSNRLQKNDTARYAALQNAMEKKLNTVVEQLSNQMLKQRMDVNGFKQEMDVYHNTLDIMSRSIKEQLQEITVMQNYQLQTIDKKFADSKASFEEHIQEEIDKIRSTFGKQLATRASEKWIEVKEDDHLSNQTSQIQLAAQDSQIGDLNKRIKLLETQMQGVFRKFDVRQDDEKQALIILNLLKNDKKLQEVFQAKFKQDAAEVFENGLSPFRVLMETRISSSMSNLQTFSLAIRRMERSMEEHNQTIDIYKKDDLEIISVQKNIDKNLQSYQDELDKIAKLVPDFADFQQEYDEQMQMCQSEINDIKIILNDQEEKMDKQAQFFEKIIQDQTQLNKEDIIDKLNMLEQSMGHKAKDKEYVNLPSSLNSSLQQPQHSYDYLDKVERQIKQIYKRIKYIKAHDGELFKYIAHQNMIEKRAIVNSIEVRLTGEWSQFRNPPRLSTLRTIVFITRLNPIAKTVKLKHQSFNAAQLSKDMFIPVETKARYPNQKNPQNGSKIYQHIISDEQFYQQYKNQIDDIQDRLNLKFEVGNMSRKSPSPPPPIHEPNSARFPPKITQHNMNQKVDIRAEDQPLSINNQILKNRKQVNNITFSNPNSRNISRSEDHSKY